MSNAQLDLDRAGDDTDLQQLIHSMVADALKSHLPDMPRPQLPDTDADRSSNEDEDFHDPRQADDGHHYIRHGGQHYQVDVGAMNGQSA